MEEINTLHMQTDSEADESSGDTHPQQHASRRTGVEATGSTTEFTLHKPVGSSSKILRTKLPPVEVALNVWASARWHSAMGGSGYPVYEQVLRDPLPVADSKQIADRSDTLYDASRSKYIRRDRISDVRVTSAIEQVERALSECAAPDWLRRYLLFKYPTTGWYGPKKRVAKNADPDYDPARAFVDSGHWQDVLGKLDSPQLRRNAGKAIKSVERAFRTILVS